MQSSLVLCLGSSAFLIVDLTLHGQFHTFPVRCQAPCSGKFACLGSHPSLAIGKGVMAEAAKAKGQNCSSKLCLSFGANELRSLQQRQLRQNYNFGTASFQLLSSKTAPK